MSRYYNDYLQHSDEDTLAHFGIPGMKWGSRKSRPSRVITSKNGDKLYLKNVNFFGKKIDGNYNIYNSSNKKVGFISYDRISDKHMHIDYITIKPKYRGKGYATSVIKDTIDRYKGTKIKQLTLDSAGLDKSAEHIYTKLGFKKSGNTITDEVWSDRTPMAYKY